MVESYRAGEPNKLAEKTRNIERLVQMTKRSQARSAGELYVPPGHKLSCDPRCGPDMYSPDIIGSYIFLQEGWRWVAICDDDPTSGGCGERNVSSYHQDARLGEAV